MINIYNKFADSKCYEVAIVVDVLRASTTITTLLSFIDEVYITTSTERREKGVYIGERKGKKIKGFDFGNSPTEILANKETIKERYMAGEDVILSTTNGTRVLKNLNADEIYIGAIINAKFVADIVKEHENVSLVPCHRENTFAIDDFIGCGIIANYLTHEFDEFVKVALELIKGDWRSLILNSSSAQNLKNLGYEGDVTFAMLENSFKVVGSYKKEESKVVRVK
ncbi:2-phosphosulfolactate phosphatase [Methanocaldococcus vulcanius M7]|uniref:2-phosphosulfolactate phosphatase n=1 Tax=Methanocaldococcus vulcanius (strain ATCC 700851 / DSM 12094 / M7) TaxID=579137 RepID=C9RF86_METVM|nr:2-phosphosulfolactate phosphatase [Methanocaldococcus vulcanius]ACX72238.1 2-phosphosulfolactate phosphatase [Methanocaldococcus vulcanius M7]